MTDSGRTSIFLSEIQQRHARFDFVWFAAQDERNRHGLLCVRVQLSARTMILSASEKRISADLRGLRWTPNEAAALRA